MANQEGDGGAETRPGAWFAFLLRRGEVGFLDDESHA